MRLLETGQKIGTNYEVDRFLGEGAFAEVYRVKHRFFGFQAMKILKQKGISLQEVESLLSEAILLSRIEHPNIIRVFDASTFDLNGKTMGFCTMEYVPGGSLHNYWRSYKEFFMPITEVVEITKQICEGLSVAHTSEPPIVHRDIKPHNILIKYDANGMRVKISDFGLAKRVNPLTLLVSSKGTLSFKPPESFQNMDSCTADVWAIGTTMYLLLTDTLPFPELDERDIQESSRFLRPFRPANVYNIQVDPVLDSILSRCLATNLSDRYPNALALRDDLSRWRPQQKNKEIAVSERSSHSKAILSQSDLPAVSDIGNRVQEAIELAQQPANLAKAADILEEAISKDAQFRTKYESYVKLWRQGISIPAKNYFSRKKSE
jgi:serine/threonine protein kinase